MLLLFKLVLTLIYLAPLTLQQDQGASYDYYYYYEDELPAKPAPTAKADTFKPSEIPLASILAKINPTAGATVPDSLAEEAPDYDIGELITAWKAYIREKAEKEKADEADEAEEDYYVDETPQPPPRRARPRPRQPPARQRRPGRPRPRQRPRPKAKDYDDYYYDETPRRPAIEKPVRSQTGRRRPGRPGRPRRPSRPRDDYDYYDEPVRRPISDFYDEEDNYECPPKDVSYRTLDDSQCDKYYECNIKGEEKELLCPDGLVFDAAQQNCDYPSKVVCGNRTKLQPAQPTKNCPRANGYFPWPAEESCQKFYDCRGGTAYLQVCPEGVIFDGTIDACTTPDQAKRIDCIATAFLNFDCPSFGPDEVLRFGNHDRLPDPDDCTKYYGCLRGGQPRLGACPRKTVFNGATGMCDDPSKVPGCETWWTDKEEDELEDYYDYS